MIISPKPQDQFNRLQQLVNENKLTELNKYEHEELTKYINAVLEASDIKAQFDINELPSRDKLNIYITDSNFSHISNCKKGNAVYDSKNDAILIDSSFLSFETYFGPTEPSIEYPLLLTFILVHELGHRQLHKDRKQELFDLNVNEEEFHKLEVEADKFGLDKLEDFYHFDFQNGEYYFSDISFSDNSTVGFNANLLQFIYEYTTTLNLVDVSYSSFYQDDTHPSIISRFQSFLEVFDNGATLPAENLAQFKIAQKVINYLVGINAKNLVEFYSTSTQKGITINENHISFLLSNSEIIKYQFPIRINGYTRINIQSKAPELTLSTQVHDEVLNFWEYDNNEYLIIFKNGKIVNVHDGTEEVLSDPFFDSEIQTVFTSKNSSKLFVLHESHITVLLNDLSKKVYDLDKIEKYVSCYLNIEDFSLKPLNVDSNTLYYSILIDREYSYEKDVSAILFLDETGYHIKDVSQDSMILGNIGYDRKFGLFGGNFTAASNGKIEWAEFVEEDNEEAHKWCIKFNQSISCRNFIDNELPTSTYGGTLNRDLDIEKPEIEFVNKDRILVYFDFPEALFQYDIKKNEIALLFFPGFGKHYTNNNYVLAHPTENGVKSYLIPFD